jgi:hypothetical protein
MSEPAPEGPALRGSISELVLYPIKGCGGVAVPEAQVTEGGLLGDRRYLVIDERGRALTQRTHPSLARMRTGLTREAILVDFPGHPPLRLPLSLEEGPRCRATVWSDEFEALEHREGSAWFTAVLGAAMLRRRGALLGDVRLVYQPASSLRRSKTAFGVSAADAYPLLLTSQTSLDDLNERILCTAEVEREIRPAQLPMNRFRPNVVVEGLPPYLEDRARRVRLGANWFDIPKLCDRCAVTTVEQASGYASKEPLRTLAKYRKWQGAVWFGANLSPLGPGVLRVGDAVELGELGPGPAPAD